MIVLSGRSLGVAAAIGVAAAAYFALCRRRWKLHARVPVFVFVDNKVHDPQRYFGEYVKAVIPTVKQFGGRYLCCPGKATTIVKHQDDEWNFETTILLEFPTMEHARRWIDDEETMAPLHAARKRYATTRMLIAEGVQSSAGGKAFALQSLSDGKCLQRSLRSL